MSLDRRKLAVLSVLALLVVAPFVARELGWLGTEATLVLAAVAAVAGLLYALDLRSAQRLRRSEQRLASRVDNLPTRDEVAGLRDRIESLSMRNADREQVDQVDARVESMAADLTAALETVEEAARTSYDELARANGERVEQLVKRSDRSHLRTVRQLEASIALNQILAGHVAMPQSSTWAASSDLLRFLHSLIVKLRPAVVLECGSGVSSAVMGRAARDTGSRIVCLEHHEQFAEKTRGWVSDLDASDHVRVIDAPLVPVMVGDASFRWYDRSEIGTVRPVDLLVVDGPPGGLQPLSRLPAVPLLLDRLSEDAVVVLDDADRGEEAEIVERWLELLPNHVTVKLQHAKGTALLAPAASLALLIE